MKKSFVFLSLVIFIALISANGCMMQTRGYLVVEPVTPVYVHKYPVYPVRAYQNSYYYNQPVYAGDLLNPNYNAAYYSNHINYGANNMNPNVSKSALKKTQETKGNRSSGSTRGKQESKTGKTKKTGR